MTLARIIQILSVLGVLAGLAAIGFAVRDIAHGERLAINLAVIAWACMIIIVNARDIKRVTERS